MSNKKINFKNMINSDKVKLINNSLVLDGLSLKELSKKINIQKKEILNFMDDEGFFFDEIDGYFKKSKEITTSNEVQSLTEIKERDSNSNSNTEREDIQSIIDSINEKLNLKDIESNKILLPEIKTNKEVGVSLKPSQKTSDCNTQTLTLEIPKISRTARRKKMKKTAMKRFFLYLRNKISKIFMVKHSKKIKEPKELKHNKFSQNRKLEKQEPANIILEEVALETLPKNKEIITNLSQNPEESKLSFEIKIPRNFKGRKRSPMVKEDLNELSIFNLDQDSLDDLKDELRTLKLNSSFIDNLNSDAIDSMGNKDLEERICTLEKKVSELEEFFLEIFQAMSTK
ncbi:hypothetical protein FHH43_11670 [Clostridium perfringens]|nr:hypothetical protein [Clostridium perfringens]